MWKENMGVGGERMGTWGEGRRVGTKGPADSLHVPDSVRAEMCRAAVNTHTVQATSTPASSQGSQSDLSATSSGVLAQACWIDTSKEKVQEEGRGDEGKLSGKSYLGLNLKTLKSPDGPSSPGARQDKSQ